MRKRYLLLFLTVALGLSLMAVDRYTREISAPTAEQQVAEPDYYGSMLISRRYGEDGQLIDTFYATSSVHYPQNDTSVFTQPQLLVSQNNNWLMTADEGVLSGTDHLLKLSGNILIRPQSDDSDWQLNTTRMQYDLNRRIASSDELVIITGESSTMTGTGMLFDADHQRLELKTGVRTHYVPE